VKNPNLLNEIGGMERVETLTEIDQKLKNDQQIIVEMIEEN